MSKARVYIDANVIKFSATRLRRTRPIEVSVQWGTTKHSSVLYEPVIVNPNDGIGNLELRREANLLPKVAALAVSGWAEFVVNFETQLEVSGLPNLDSETGRFYGAPYSVINAPVQYGRIVFGGNKSYKQEQLEFLCSLDDQRFGQLQRATGAYQGENQINRNQLLDAFHLWCAEHNRCDFFLSLDFKLAKVVAKSKVKPKVPIVTPSELLARSSER